MRPEALLTRRTALAGAGAFAALPAAAQPRFPAPEVDNSAGLEAALERPVGTLKPKVRLAPAFETGKALTINGTVFNLRGKPQPGVVVYAYHANADGLYAGGSRETLWSQRHGRLRGWMVTGPDGRYAFETIKPAPYPSFEVPAHIHMIVVEPGREPYWVDQIVFAGEFKVDRQYHASQALVGGSGIIKLAPNEAGVLTGVRDIRLGNARGTLA